MTVAKTIGFDVSDLEALGRDLQLLDAQTLSEMRRDAATTVGAAVRERAIQMTMADLNLPEAYIRARITQDESGDDNHWTTYVRSGIEGTTLQRFGAGAQQLHKDVNWSNDTIASRGFEVGPWVEGKWTLRTGDASRGIPVDRKQNGVAVAVKRGQGAKRIATAFTMPLRRANAAAGNGTGVFRRDASGNLRHLYGPSVYQTFRSYITRNEADIADTLRDEFLVRFDRYTLDLAS